MDIANYLSQKMDYMTKETFNAMHTILAKNFPKFDMRKYNIENYFAALARDKKNIGNNLICILAKKPGELFKIQIPFGDNLKRTINSYFFYPISD
jgi:3-dehydroquinate synthetase